MKAEEFRQEAEKHWSFVEKLLKAYRGIEEPESELKTVSMEACHFLYVEAMVHGYKHCEEDVKK